MLPAAVLALAACAATVSCPDPEGDTRTAILLDHGRHASLVLENPDGGTVRYSWGDRRWYADDDTSFASGFNALFRRTPAVLARRELAAPPGIDAVRAALGVVVEHAWAVDVPAARSDRLLDDLETAFYSDPAAIFRNDDYRLDFAPHPRPYTLAYNSNHMVADWLRELGCDVRGSPKLSNWRWDRTHDR